MSLPECWPAAKPDAPTTPTGKLLTHVFHEDWFKWSKIKQAEFIKTEVLLGITICFAQVPESVAFAFMAHIKPPVALHAAWVVGLICTLFGGRSGMVNGAEGAFAAIISTMVAVPDIPGQNGEGIELLFPSVMCAGVFMLGIWATGSDRFITLMAASIMDGFCCGLAIVIGLSQLHPFQLGHGESQTWRSLSDLQTWFMIIIMLCSMLTMEFVPKIPSKIAKLFPSSLLAILVACAIEFVLVRNLPCSEEDIAATHGGSHRRLAASAAPIKCTTWNTSRTDVIGDVTPFEFTSPYPFFLNSDYLVNGTYTLQGDQSGQIIVQGALLAIAGVVQGLMTTEVVTSFVKTPAHTPSIVWSMGVANLVSGFLGGMGGDAMIGLSTINCLNGGRGRLAPTVTALGVMLCTMVAYPLLDFIPISALAGVMIVVVLHTFKWAKLPMIISACLPAAARPKVNAALCAFPLFPAWFKLPLEVDRWESLIIVAVSFLTIQFNLVIGVAVGIFLAAARYTYTASLQLSVTAMPGEKEGAKKYVVRGPLFFGSSMRFHTHFDVDNDPDEVLLIMPAKPTEYSAIDALNRVGALYAAQKKTFTIEFAAADPSLELLPNPQAPTTNSALSAPVAAVPAAVEPQVPSPTPSAPAPA